MIVCVTPNPAVDRTLSVDRLTAGDVVRAHTAREAAGGKGINVARVVRDLGAPSRACAPIGGATGERIAALAAGESLDVTWTAIAGESRTCTIVVETDGRSTVINELGPSIARHEWQAFVDSVVGRARSADVVTISGSMPGDTNVEGFVDLLDAVRSCGPQVWVDASGPVLRAAMTVPGVALKVNRHEAREAIAGAPADPSILALARHLLTASHASAVAVTDGAAGAAWVDHDECSWCAAPAVTPVNATGSGDAFLAGLAVSMWRGDPPAAALRHAIAVGAAAAASLTPTVDRATVASMVASMKDDHCV